MSGRGREAAANEREASVEPGSARARLRLACDPAVVAEARRAVARSVDPSSTSGWGLQLVDRLASDWGVVTGSGTCVWCEIATG